MKAKNFFWILLFCFFQPQAAEVKMGAQPQTMKYRLAFLPNAENDRHAGAYLADLEFRMHELRRQDAVIAGISDGRPYSGFLRFAGKDEAGMHFIGEIVYPATPSLAAGEAALPTERRLVSVIFAVPESPEKIEGVWRDVWGGDVPGKCYEEPWSAKVVGEVVK